MIKAQFFHIPFLILISFSCAKKSKKLNPEISPPSSYKYIIYEDSLQNITLNDISVSVGELDSSLKELKIKGGIVFYQCKTMVNCPPDHSLVVNLILKYGFTLNVLISKPDYQYIPANKNIR